MKLNDVLEFMKDTAWRAGELMMQHIGGGYQVYTKPDRSRVTDVDLAISKLLQERLPKALPGLHLYSEESPKQPIDRSKPYLIADELDGTSYYIDFKKGFSHQSAFYEPGEGLRIGLVHYPDLDTLIYAVKGQGAFMQKSGGRPEPIAPLAVKPYESLIYAHPLRYRGGLYRNLYTKLGASDAQILRTDATRTLLMAKGELDVNVFLMPKIPYWDICGEKVIVEALGYSHSYLNGREVEFGVAPPRPNLGYLICPAPLAEQFRSDIPRLIA